jgi:hypothetical protein
MPGRWVAGLLLGRRTVAGAATTPRLQYCLVQVQPMLLRHWFLRLLLTSVYDHTNRLLCGDVLQGPARPLLRVSLARLTAITPLHAVQVQPAIPAP